MQRLDFIIVATTQFTPFQWILEDKLSKEEESEAHWVKEHDLKQFETKDYAIRKYRAIKNPLDYLYFAFGKAWDLAHFSVDDPEKKEKTMKSLSNAFRTIAVDIIGFIAEQIGIEHKDVPSSMIPVTKISNPDDYQTNEFYKTFIDNKLFRQEFDTIMSLMNRIFEERHTERKRHRSKNPRIYEEHDKSRSSSPDPWKMDKRGQHEKAKILKILLTQIFASYIRNSKNIHNIFDIFSVITTKHMAFMKTRPHWKYQLPQEKIRLYFNSYIREMTDKIQFIVEHFPEIGTSEASLLGNVLEHMPSMRSVEPHIWIYDHILPQTKIWSAMEKLASIKGVTIEYPNIQWIRLGDSIEPHMASDIDGFHPGHEYNPIGIDINVYDVEQYTTDASTWTREMAKNSEELRIVTYIGNRVTSSSIIEPLHTKAWKIVFEFTPSFPAKSDSSTVKITYQLGFIIVDGRPKAIDGDQKTANLDYYV